MGYDSSWSFLKPLLMWREKSLFSEIWVDQTNPFLDSSALLAAPIYGITGNILFSYGLSNLIILSLILLYLHRIFKQLKLVRIAQLVAFNLVICPYLTNGFNIGNDLGYFSNLISGPAFYSLRALTCLLVFSVHLDIQTGKKLKWSIVPPLLLCMLSGLSSGIFIMIVILLPYLLYEIEHALIYNRAKRLLEQDALFCYLCLISTVIGKALSSTLLVSIAIDNTRTWTTLENIWINVGAVIQGFMKLLSVLPISNNGIRILSEEGTAYLFPLCIFFIILLSLGYAFVQLKREILVSNGSILFILNVLVSSFLIFSLFNAQYGSDIFEERYLTCMFMFVIILVAYWVDCIDQRQLYAKMFMGLLCLAIIGNNYVSDKAYIQTTNESWQMKEIRSAIQNTDAKLIYFWGNSEFATARSMRVLDPDRVYKCISDTGEFHHWGDYLYYENNEDYTGPTILIANKTENTVPSFILNQYKLLSTFQHVNLYISNCNPIDMQSGLTGTPTSIDYPYTPGMIVQNGKFENGCFISDGTAGHAIYGPYTATREGIFDFTLEYAWVSDTGASAYFDVALDSGISLAATPLNPQSTSITIPDIALTPNHLLEYRVYCEEGTQIKVKRILITEKE